MKVRESGMPGEESHWTQFFNPENVLQQMELTAEVNSVADLGCGFGTFSVPASKLISSELHAFDIDEIMINILQNKIDSQQIKNIKLHLRDFISEGTGLSDNSIDYAMLFNILHHENPYLILHEVHRILKKGAKAGIIHWRRDIPTPRGPSLEIRPAPEQCKKWSINSGFAVHKELLIESYHFGLIIIKI